MKSLHTILVSSIAFSGAAAEPLLECPGLVTDKTPDWRFEASAAKGGETFNPLEGWYPDKGGKLVSPRIALPKANAYYRLSFTASTPSRRPTAGSMDRGAPSSSSAATASIRANSASRSSVASC